VIAREISDVRLVIDTLAPTESVSTPITRIGIVHLKADDIVGADQRDALRRAGAAAALIADVSDVDWPHDRGVAGVFEVLQAKDVLHSHRDTFKTWPSQRDVYGGDVRSRLQFAEKVTDDDVARARVALDSYANTWNAALADCDVVVTPVAGSGPSLILDPTWVRVNNKRMSLRDMAIRWNAQASLLGLPACSIPAGFDSNGIPVGVQIIGRRDEDNRVLEVAELLRDALRP
jgi:aspartyl-tRNA(Asn)/glutamyl-tRNA(Gln) amidotransferase subunit A